MTSLSSTERQCICRIRGDPIVQDCDGQILTLSQVGFFEVASFVGSDTCPSFRVSDVTNTKRWRHSCNMLFIFAFSRSWRLKMWEVIWSSRPTSSSLSTKWWRWKLKAILTSEWVKHNVTMSRHLTLCPGNYNNIFSVIKSLLKKICLLAHFSLQFLYILSMLLRVSAHDLNSYCCLHYLILPIFRDTILIMLYSLKINCWAVANIVGKKV